MELPLSFEEICTQITCFTNLPRDEVEQRVWKEVVEPGWNVQQDITRLGATPFQYDSNMLRLYTEGYGFVFECMVFWAKPNRQLWAQHAADRIARYETSRHLAPDQVSILTLGDGVGSDSIYLAAHGFTVYYFDVPGSRTFDFASKRISAYDHLNHRIHLVHNYEECLARDFDVVLSYEGLEHLPDPVHSIRDISTMVRAGGIALITEDFGNTAPYLPTHLKVSSRLKGKTPFLFLRNSMVLTWYSRDPLFKPYEFTKQGRTSALDWYRLLRDRQVRAKYLSEPSDALVALIRRVQYCGR